MNPKFLILASILIICAFVQETSAQYYGYPSYYGGYYGSVYGYAYPYAYYGYGKRSAGFQPSQQQPQQPQQQGGN